MLCREDYTSTSKHGRLYWQRCKCQTYITGNSSVKQYYVARLYVVSVACVYVFEQINVQLRVRVPSPGEYVLVVEYTSEEKTSQTLTVSVNTPGGRNHQEHISLLHCKYRCDTVCVHRKQ